MNKGRLFIKYLWTKRTNCTIPEVWEALSHFLNLILEVPTCTCTRLYVHNDKKVILVAVYNTLGYHASHV